MENRTVKMKTLIITFVEVLLVGCSPIISSILPQEVNQNQNQITLIPSTKIPSTAMPTGTEQLTDLNIKTPTIVPEVSSTFTPTKSIPTYTETPVRICKNNGFPVMSPNDMEYHGEVLLLPRKDNELKTLNLETRTISSIYFNENSQVSAFGSPPNEKWLVYAVLTYKPNGYIRDIFTLVLISKTGERIEHQIDVSPFKDLFMEDEFVGFGNRYWINNDLIYTTLLVQNPSEFSSKTYGSIPVIFNPFVGSWEQNLLKLTPEWSGKSEIGFSPDLQSVVLQSVQEIKLKDLKNGKYLWNTKDFFLEIPNSKIRWSPDGNIVAVGERFPDPKVFLVSADGSNSETIPIGKIEGFLDFEWSPNSELLMIYHSYGTEEKKFYMYDLIKHEIVFTCSVQQPWDILFQWSPDSNKVIYGTIEGNLQILDISSGIVAKLDIQDVLPFSWTQNSFSH